MSRHLPSKSHQTSQVSSINSIKPRISPSPKGRPTRLGAQSLSKSPTRNFLHNNSKINESNISKSRILNNKKDILSEVSPQEKIEFAKSLANDGRSKEKNQKPNVNKNGSFVSNANENIQSKSGELIRKLVSKKRSKAIQHKEAEDRGFEVKGSKQGPRIQEQEVVSSDFDSPNPLMGPLLGFANNMQTSEFRKKESKLSASLMSNPEYLKNIKQSDSHFQSLTNVSRNASSNMISRHASNKFTDCELESDLTEKRTINQSKNLYNQESDSLSSNAYRLFKYQMAQEKVKAEALANDSSYPEIQESSSNAKYSMQSSKISPRKRSHEKSESVSNKNLAKRDSKGSRLKQLKKRKKDDPSPNKAKSTEIYKNKLQNSSISQQLINTSLLPNEAARQSFYILGENKDINFEPNSSFIKKGIRDTRERVGTEPKSQSKGIKSQLLVRDNMASPQKVVDLDQMNVKQLIELKNLIDEKIEVEELRNKADHLKTKKVMKSLGDEKLYNKRGPIEPRQIRDENTDWRASHMNFGKIDNRALWRHNLSAERVPLDNHGQGISFNASYLKDSDLNMRHDRSMPHFSLSQTLHPENIKIGYSHLSTKEDFGQKGSKSEIENVYNQKLKEFLEARDRMLQITEPSIEEIDLDKFKEIPNRPAPVEIKSYNSFISLNGLLKVNSPDISKSQAIKQNGREFLIKSMMGSPVGNNQFYKQKCSNSCLESLQEHIETAKFEEEAKPSIKIQEIKNRRSNFSNLTVQIKKDLQNRDLMQLINEQNQNDKEKPGKNSQLYRSSETGTRLTKKDIQDLILKANEIADTPYESNDEYLRDEIYLRQDFGLAKNNLEQKGLANILGPQLAAGDDPSLLETPTTNMRNLDSKNTSSIIETDLSILAINKQLAMMRSDLD